MAKRGQGEGTISKRPDGTYWARITLGKDANGKQKRKAFYGKTRKEVQEKLTAALNDINNDSFIEPSRITVTVWLDMWLNEYKKNALKPTTFITYQRYCRDYLKPDLGKCLLKDLKNVHIQKVINSMVDKGLKPRTIEYLKVIISNALNQAVKNELIRKNVAIDVILPKREKTEKRVLSPYEQKRFIEAAKADCHGEFYILALATGLRHGELLALTWDDIDFEEANLNVTKTMYLMKDILDTSSKWQFEVGTPKTPTSNRVVPLLPNVVEMLKRLKEKQDILKLHAGSARYGAAYKGKQERSYKNNNLIFCTFEGNPLRQSDMLQRLFKLFEAAEIEAKGMNIHSLRHTFATRGLESGIELKVMQELLGHASIKMTADLYTHVLPSKKKSAILKLEGSIQL